MARRRARNPKSERARDAEAVRELDRIRGPLLREVAERASDPGYYRGRSPGDCCTRPLNRMRISPAEARAIAAALRREPALKRRMPAVLARLEESLRDLHEGEARQPFDCPLLEGSRCLVHDHAKPIGCTAWHPPGEGEDVEWSPRAWRAFADRDRLNDRLWGPDWKLRVIPLWLRRVLRRELGARAQRRRADSVREGEPGRRSGAPRSPGGRAGSQAPERGSGRRGGSRGLGGRRGRRGR